MFNQRVFMNNVPTFGLSLQAFWGLFAHSQVRTCALLMRTLRRLTIGVRLSGASS